MYVYTVYSDSTDYWIQNSKFFRISEIFMRLLIKYIN